MHAQLNNDTEEITAVLTDFGFASLSETTSTTKAHGGSQTDAMLISESHGLHRFELNVGTPAFLA